MILIAVIAAMVEANLGTAGESKLIEAVVNNTDATPIPCLRAEFTATLTLNDDKINLSDNVTTAGSDCGKLQLQDLNTGYQLVLDFTNNTGETWSLDAIVVTSPTNVTYQNQTITSVSAPLNTKWGQSFLCTKGFEIPLDDASITLGRIQIQPFKVPEDTYANPVICAEDINKVIPAVVGSILALLVVLVLVTYVIGRRRTRIAYQEI